MAGDRAPPDALFAVLGRAKFGFDVAAAGVATAIMNAFVAGAMSREETQELGGRTSSEVTARTYSKLRFKEVSPEMRSAAARPGDRRR